MNHLGFGEAFSRFGARPKNLQWSVCAQAPDGALVVSCWEHYFSKKGDGAIQYSDDLARWRGPGNTELRQCIAHAFHSGQAIRAVIAKAHDTVAVEAGVDASKIKKSFSVKADWIGKVIEFDGQMFVIEFIRGA